MCKRRGLHVGSLQEFLPTQKGLLGMNTNHGQKIQVSTTTV